MCTISTWQVQDVFQFIFCVQYANSNTLWELVLSSRGGQVQRFSCFWPWRLFTCSWLAWVTGKESHGPTIFQIFADQLHNHVFWRMDFIGVWQQNVHSLGLFLFVFPLGRLAFMTDLIDWSLVWDTEFSCCLSLRIQYSPPILICCAIAAPD